MCFLAQDIAYLDKHSIHHAMTQCTVTNLACVDYASAGVHMLDVAVSVHVMSL